MSDDRQTVEAYLRISEALLQMEAHTDAELEAIDEMLERVSSKLLNDIPEWRRLDFVAGVRSALLPCIAVRGAKAA
jgi:hypothetical protein